jgi:chemotaxis protein MotB
MTNLTSKRGARFVLLFAAPVLFSGCVSQEEYDGLQARSEQQLAAKDAEIVRLRETIRYAVNGGLIFRPRSCEMTRQGQEIIARMAQKLAPDQQSKLVITDYTDNAPIGASLRRQGIDTNEALSQKRAEAVMEYLISRGVKPEMVSAHAGGEAEPVARVELTLASAF